MVVVFYVLVMLIECFYISLSAYNLFLIETVYCYLQLKWVAIKTSWNK